MQTDSPTQTESTPQTATLAGKYLTFALGHEEFGLPILNVKEIIGSLDIIAVPRTPPSIKGVINLRGRVIPVIDLRTRFNMPSVEKTDQTCIIVVELTSQGHTTSKGVIVDRVSEVLTIPQDALESPPESLQSSLDSRFILALAKISTSVKILLDLPAVLEDTPTP